VSDEGTARLIVFQPPGSVLEKRDNPGSNSRGASTDRKGVSMKAPMKRFFAILSVLILALIAILAIRTVTITSRQITASPADLLKIDRHAALERFSRAVQFQTISYEESGRPVEHDAFVAWLAQTYPRAHGAMQREVVGNRSLLYTWRGIDPALAPVLLSGLTRRSAAPSQTDTYGVAERSTTRSP
jgi:hypothetical protein